MKGLFLFGAGASYGSDQRGTPPLGTSLFDELQKFNPDGWGKIPHDLSTHFHQDFEGAIKTVNPTALAPLQRAMAAYFFNFQPQASNLYMSLARRIFDTSWAGSICTLNYERLLEISLSSNGIKPVVGNSTKPGKTIELCLPHGCCHLFCDAVKATAGAVKFNAFAVATNGPVRVISDPTQHRQRIMSDEFPPVMSYFEPRKHTTSGQSFIDSQRRRWKELATEAQSIAIIGVKIRPHDNHIWSPLANTPGRIIYCSGPSGRSDYSTWSSSVGRPSHDLVLDGFFCDEFDRICDELEL